MSGAPSVEHELGLSDSAYVAFAFAAPLLVAAALEGVLALFSDAWGRRKLLVAGQAGLAAALAFAAWTRSAWGLTAGLAVAGAASGLACGAAQAILVLEHPRGAERAMVSWTLFASIGDVLTPLATAAAIALGGSYRAAMIGVSVVVGLQCAAAARPGGEARAAAGAAKEAKEGDPQEPLRSALERALRRPGLWTWLFAAASCTLLDELVVALAALRLQREQGASEASAAAAAVTFAAGSLVGAAVTDRAIARVGSRRVMLASGTLCAVALGVAIEPRSAIASVVALFVVGVTCAPHHPLAQARAYAEMPDHPGTVQAVGQLFVVVDVAAPLALGAVADRFGLRAAMACLLLQPLVIVACAVFRGSARPRGA